MRAGGFAPVLVLGVAAACSGPARTEAKPPPHAEWNVRMSDGVCNASHPMACPPGAICGAPELVRIDCPPGMGDGDARRIVQPHEGGPCFLAPKDECEGRCVPAPSTCPGSRAAAPGCDLTKLELDGATPLPGYKLPNGCAAPEGLGGHGGEVRVSSEQEFRSKFRCPKDVPPGIDFARNQLVIQTQSLSPLGVGGEFVDDGKRIIYLQHERRPCPNEPHFMPMSIDVMFLIPAGAEREFVRAGGSCTVATCEKK